MHLLVRAKQAARVRRRAVVDIEDGLDVELGFEVFVDVPEQHGIDAGKAGKRHGIVHVGTCHAARDDARLGGMDRCQRGER